jgi:hypothetical protein
MSNQTTSTSRGFADNGDYTDRARTTPRQLSTETRPSIRTSEFLVLVVTSLAVIIAAYLDDAFNVEHGWTLVAVIATGYMISRGIAKAGSREPYRVERDQ